MKNYFIEIKETLKRVVSIEAENLEEAFEKVEDAYNNEEIVLSACDFDGVAFQNYKITEIQQ